LQFVADKNGAENYYAEELLGGKKFFTAIYPDVAVSKACISCHNGPEDLPQEAAEVAERPPLDLSFHLRS
jgi:Protein of unknown function (DUF3365)